MLRRECKSLRSVPRRGALWPVELVYVVTVRRYGSERKSYPRHKSPLEEQTLMGTERGGPRGNLQCSPPGGRSESHLGER